VVYIVLAHPSYLDHSSDKLVDENVSVTEFSVAQVTGVLLSLKSTERGVELEWPKISQLIFFLKITTKSC